MVSGWENHGVGAVLGKNVLAPWPDEHEVLFYDGDRQLLASVGRYVADGLCNGERVVVVATSPHIAGIEDELSSHGVDAALARGAGDYLTLDAAETLASFMVDGSPDVNEFMRVIGGVVESAGADGHPVRAFGEMVALLWDVDDVAGALALESYWNVLGKHQRFSLLCAYPTTALGSAELSEVHEVCQLHSAVLPQSSYHAPLPTAGTRDVVAHSSVFVAAPQAVAAARRVITEALEGWGQNALVPDATLITSELATNAVTHGDSAFRASISLSGNVVRITVQDTASGSPRTRALGPWSVHGRGMALIEALSQSWGCERLDEGKVLWVELHVPPGDDQVAS